MAYDDHESIKISLHNITYSYMNIVTNGKNGISLSGAVYDIGLNGKFSKYEPTPEDRIKFHCLENKEFKNLASFGQFFKWSSNGVLHTDLFVNENTFNWLRDGLTKYKKDFFKNISLNLWIDTKLDPETEKYWVESFSIEHVDGNRFAL
tara:strand:+ start:351 stop:797 length:447 start_codon:yes stop_codon:yes gene_type:complete